MRLQNMKRSEETEQIRVATWAEHAIPRYPELRWLHHIPNEGKRDNGGKLLAMGLKKGVSDLCLPYPKGCYIGAYIEMKFGHNQPTKEQIEFMVDMDRAGHFVCVCYSAEAAIDVLCRYLELPKNNVFMVNSMEGREVRRDVHGIPVIA